MSSAGGMHGRDGWFAGREDGGGVVDDCLGVDVGELAGLERGQEVRLEALRLAAEPQAEVGIILNRRD